MLPCSGRLVVLEGIDNAGKTSIIEELARAHMGDLRVPLTVCRERTSPIGTMIADGALGKLSPFFKVYLFAADRAWIYERQCVPALRSGHLVLWDRYVDSAVAYRKAELMLHPPEYPFDIGLVLQVNSEFLRPDLTLYVDICSDTSVQRDRSAGKTTPYDPEFLEVVRQNYLDMAVRREYSILNGERDLDVVVSEAAAAIKTTFRELFTSHAADN